MNMYYIGHSVDQQIRYSASSGGIGVLIQRYLLESKQFSTSITFQFNQDKKMYEPVLIHASKEVNICGSVYQDIDVLNFIRSNIDNIVNGIIVSCPPCQVVPIRRLLDKKGIRSFIISFCCSGQTTIEGTWKYYELLNIPRKDVLNIQYRGNGWPSGVQIKLSDGRQIYYDNYTEPWSTLHRSELYKPKRCFYCRFSTSYKSDISLADPWLDNYLKNDKLGNTMFLVNTILGNEVLSALDKFNLISYRASAYNQFYQAQKPNVEKGNRVLNHGRYIKCVTYLIFNKSVHSFFSKDLKHINYFVKLKKIIRRIL